MAGLLVKLVVCPVTVILASVLFQNVHYVNLFQPIIVGLILALAAHMMEVLLLREETFWLSTIMDVVAATLIVYYVSMFLSGAVVTFFGAFLTAMLLGITEYFQHRWLIHAGKTKKSPA